MAWLRAFHIFHSVAATSSRLGFDQISFVQGHNKNKCSTVSTPRLHKEHVGSEMCQTLSSTFFLIHHQRCLVARNPIENGTQSLDAFTGSRGQQVQKAKKSQKEPRNLWRATWVRDKVERMGNDLWAGVKGGGQSGEPKRRRHADASMVVG
ncbi:uncharacterized protein LOC115689321 isoform X2 [Syzygium oleosum]|nr:uncharacterized protein LOC115689321 isoform X2 [Syzygium oleosum]